MLRVLTHRRPTFALRSWRGLATQCKGNPDVYLHPANSDQGQFALSFLQDEAKVKGPAIIGWLKHGNEVTPQEFVDNKEFINFMHKVIRASLHSDLELEHQALLQKQGWMHIQDYRNPAYANRIPETEDIVGSVRLENGKMVDDSYEPMPVHRLVTRNGLFQLNKPLQAALISATEHL